MDRLFGQATPRPPPTLKPPPPTSDRSHLRLLLISAEPAGAEPESSCSPARDRDAGAGRNELDTGEHRPQSPAQEQVTTALTQGGPRYGRGSHEGCECNPPPMKHCDFSGAEIWTRESHFPRQ